MALAFRYLLLGCAIPLLAQGPEKLFSEQCAVCHGEDAHGTDRAPSLAGSRRVRSRSVEQLREIIQNGVPDAGMPAFHLPASSLDTLAAFIHSLNSPAADSAVPGDAAAGESFFFGAGDCASCHMVHGRGAPIGPDLSSIGREQSVEEIRQSVLDPGARIAAGYGVVDVQLRSGRTIRGFARHRTNFEIQVEDFQGKLHLLHGDEIASVREEKQSPMPAVKANAPELRDLIAYLSHLTGVTAGAVAIPQNGETPSPAFHDILRPAPGDWLTYNGSVSGSRYSELKQIDAANVSRLVPKWSYAIPHFGLEATPIVSGGVMYVTGPNSVYALDALTGVEIWRYGRPRTPGLLGDAALGTNRGVAILGDKVFMMTDNAHLIALNRTTGSLVWEQVLPDEPMHYGSTVAPLIVKDMVVTGVSGGDRGIRGFLSAYNASTGERLWRFWTIPKRGDPGIESWKGSEPAAGGGATWLTGSYDPETDTLYWPIGNPYPDSDDHDRGGDNLYSDSILAMNPATGKLKWYYQVTPHDIHDWDTNQPLVLVDAPFHGEPRKLLVHADRNGFFYVLDRVNGKLLLTDKLVKVNWATGIGPDGRPQLLPAYAPKPGGSLLCPTEATNYGATAFSPVTHFYYVMVLENCAFIVRRGTWTAKHPPVEPGQKYVRAIDIETGKPAWEIPLIGSIEGKQWSGIMATAGGLVFYGDPNGAVVAVDQRHGKPLWHYATGEIIKASPMTYAVNGKQFVALAAGSQIIAFGLP